ncbi:NAD-dependent epimerase/dehydratase family protein [Spirosoma horti]
MNILLTGASGFLGSRIHQQLVSEHCITTLGRTACSSRHILCNLAGQVPNLADRRFDVVIHAAGKANAVPRTAAERADYQRVNGQGTAHLLNALEKLPSLPTAFVHLSTVLVYGCSSGQELQESTPLLATDPYGASKIDSEKWLQIWATRTGVRLAILRLPLVVAEPLHGNLAILQTAIRRGYYVRIGNGLARRSLVRADDVTAVLIRAAHVGGTFNLTDGYHPTVRELEEAIARNLGRKRPIPSVPLSLINPIARLGDGINAVIGRRFPVDSIALQKLTSTLTFSDERARQQLDWHPRPVLDIFQ